MELDYGMPDAAMLGEILTIKVSKKETKSPQDYTGVPVETYTEEEEEINLADLMGGPAPMRGAAPMMMAPNMAPAPPLMMGGMPQMPQMAQMPQPQQQMPGSMGVQAAQSVMQQPFG